MNKNIIMHIIVVIIIQHPNKGDILHMLLRSEFQWNNMIVFLCVLRV